jgi:hypothetical protein
MGADRIRSPRRSQNGKIALWTEKIDVTQFNQVEMSPAEAVTN